jgi:predicted ATPase/transcriptional regulator with XRE-family HTH domain
MKQQRKSLDMTQELLAERVGYALSTIRKIEAGVLRPSREIAERLAECLEIAPSDQASFVRLARAPLTTEKPAPSVLAVAPQRSTIPAQATPLIDREREVATICQQIAQGGVRLLTLYGPPGIGKTRLAIQAATVIRDTTGIEVFFVSLTTISDPALVAMTIAQALGIGESTPASAVDQLKRTIDERRIVLVLDNFEHVLAATALISDVLAACSRLSVIVTSRAVLRLRGEHQFPVPSLNVPNLEFAPTWEAFEKYSAVALFIACARAVVPTFRLTADNAAFIGIICARLDGLPLAIELIAARIKLMSPQQLALRLGNRLSLLTSKEADRPTRHQTLRAAIDWSYSLLSSEEQQVFVRLSIFTGGCTLEAAEVVSNDDAGSIDVADCIASLLDKSMLYHVDDGTDEPRFAMLEMIHEYTAERLAALGEVALLHRRHADYFASLARDAEPHLQGKQQCDWFNCLELELDNLRAAIAWHASHNVDAGLSLAANLFHFCHARGHLREGQRWLEDLLARGGHDSLVRARALSAAGFLAYHQGEHQRAIVLSEESLVLYRQHNQPQGIAAALYNLGSAALCLSEYDQALTFYTESLALYQSLNNTLEAAQVLKNMGIVAKEQGDYINARRLIEESLRLRQAAGDARATANSLINLSIVAYWQGDYAYALRLGNEGLEIHRSLNDMMGAAYALDIVAMAAFKQHNYLQAIPWLEESLEIFRTVHDNIGLAMVLNDLGCVLRAAGDFEQAVRVFCESIAIAQQLGEKRRLAFGLEGLAAIVEPEWALTLLSAAAALREAIGAPLPPIEQVEHDQLLAQVRRQLDPASCQAAWLSGQARPLVELVAEVDLWGLEYVSARTELGGALMAG